MKTLELLSTELKSVPLATSWYLSDLGEARGKQELFTKQSPQKLKVLREHALIESAISSNRIEGVTVDQSRVGTIIFGKSVLRDRDEEAVRGYRDALKLIHEHWSELEMAEETILRLHKISRANIGDAGQYKAKDGDIIEKYPDGRVRVRFKTVTAADTPDCVREMIRLWDAIMEEGRIQPLIAMAAMNLDFLCIHPFRDGNGRVSRLLLLLTCYHLGFGVGRYISLERLIEQNKERYYETLDQSSLGWHEGKHDPWPYVNYLLVTLKSAYREFEERVGNVSSPKGAKTELVLSAIERAGSTFRAADLQRACPGVSLDMIRRVLKDLRNAERVECLGRGQNAEWRRTDKWELGNI
jgi:Fic family protein